MKKGLIISLSVICSIILILGGAMLIWYFGKSYKNFNKYASKQWQIPGLSDGFTPQGIWSTQNNFLTCGYMKDGSASRIYVVDNNQKYFTLTIEGKPYTGHCGGIATYKNLGYVVGDKHIYVFNITEALKLENGKSIKCLAVLDAPNGADFINIDNDYLYVGEFYHEKKYPTADNHKISCADGKNVAVTYVYALSDDNPFYISSTPSYAISTTEKIQGMCFTDSGNVILSQSWSLADSHILAYKPLSEVTKTDFDYNGAKIDLYILDSTSLLTDISAPCMSEEIYFGNGKVYIMFENACKKYRLVTRTRLKNVYSLDIDKYL